MDATGTRDQPEDGRSSSRPFGACWLLREDLAKSNYLMKRDPEWKMAMKSIKGKHHREWIFLKKTHPNHLLVCASKSKRGG